MRKKEADEMRKKKQEIVAQATKVVMDEVSSRLQTKMKESNLEIRVKVQNNNRYFGLHRYGEDLRILVYQSGDVDCHFKDILHSDVSIRVIHYEDTIEDKDIMEQFRKDVELMVTCFFRYDWHIFMDYMSDMKERSWRDTMKMFIEEWAAEL